MSATLRLLGAEKSFGYVQVLDGLDLTVPKGAVYGFLGRNGAGKTTTLHALLGLTPLDAGTIELFGEIVASPGIPEKRRIGFVGQEQHLYPWMNAVDLGRFVGALYPTWDADRYEDLLMRFDVPQRRRVDALSGGTQVKLALCLALAPSPDLLILDEPTAGLDPIARRELLDLISEQARTEGRTTIFSGHVVSEIQRVADIIGILDAGRLQWEGPTAEAGLWHRDVISEHAPDLPEGLSLLGKRNDGGTTAWIVRGSPDAWDASDLHGVPLSLDEVFLANTLYRIP